MQWLVAGQTAKLSWSSWTWVYQLAQPSSGVAVLSQNQEPWHLLAIDPVPGHACQIDDWFARGSDLMVRYGQSAGDSFAFQVDYRAVPQGELEVGACGFDVWLSVQTQLLDSHPILDVTNRVPSGVWRATNADGLEIEEGPAATVTCKNHGGQVALLVHPSDQGQSELLAEAGQSRIRLFGNFMEKGVIRRARLRCLVSASPIASSTLNDIYSRFANGPLPLTT